MHADDLPVHPSAQRTAEAPGHFPPAAPVTRMIDGGPVLGTGPGDPFGASVSPVQPLLLPLINSAVARSR